MKYSELASTSFPCLMFPTSLLSFLVLTSLPISSIIHFLPASTINISFFQMVLLQLISFFFQCLTLCFVPFFSLNFSQQKFRRELGHFQWHWILSISASLKQYAPSHVVDQMVRARLLASFIQAMKYWRHTDIILKSGYSNTQHFQNVLFMYVFSQFWPQFFYYCNLSSIINVSRRKFQVRQTF